MAVSFPQHSPVHQKGFCGSGKALLLVPRANGWFPCLPVRQGQHLGGCFLPSGPVVFRNETVELFVPSLLALRFVPLREPWLCHGTCWFMGRWTQQQGCLFGVTGAARGHRVYPACFHGTLGPVALQEARLGWGQSPQGSVTVGGGGVKQWMTGVRAISADATSRATLKSSFCVALCG